MAKHIILLLFALLSVSAYSQVEEYRDTLDVDNALIRGLTLKTGDTLLLISNDTVYSSLVRGSSMFSQDTFFVAYVCDSNAGGWVYSGDSIFVDTCGSNTTLPGYWKLQYNVLVPINAFWGVGVGDYENRLYHDADGLNIYGSPQEIAFYIGGTEYFDMYYGPGADYFGPAIDGSIDLGRTTAEWNNGYFDGTLQTDFLKVDGLVNSDLRPFSSNTYDLGDGTYKWRNGRFAGDVIVDSDVGIGTSTLNAKLNINNPFSPSGEFIHLYNSTDLYLSIYGENLTSKETTINSPDTLFIEGEDRLSLYSDGTIDLLGGTADLKITDGAIYPRIDESADIGKSSNKFKDGWFGGSLAVDNTLSLGGYYTDYPIYTDLPLSGGYDTAFVFGYLGAVGDVYGGAIAADYNYAYFLGSSIAVLEAPTVSLSETTSGTSILYDDGDLYPSVNESVDIGNSTNKFKDGYFSGKITQGTSGNTTVLDTNGITLSGDNTVWDDMRVRPTTEGVPIARIPDWEAYKGSYLLAFGDETEPNESQVFFVVQMSHTYKGGSDIRPHVHWTAPLTSATDSIRWEFTYSWANIGSTFPIESTLAAATLVGTTADKHQITGLGTIDGTGKTESSMIICSLKRTSSNASDTFSNDIYLLGFDIHFEVSKMGTRNEIPD